MKKNNILFLILIIIFVSFMFNFYISKNKLGINNSSKREELVLCDKKYIKDKERDYKVIDKNKVLVKSNINSFTELYLLDGCTGKKIEIYSGPGTSNIENNILFNFDNYMISTTNNGAYENEYKDLYYLNLLEVKDVLVYKKLELTLNKNETLLNYEISCGEGCDKETRNFSATTTIAGLTVDIFDRTLKENEVISGKDILVNKKVRSILIESGKLK